MQPLPPFILASASPRRKHLLEGIGIQPTVVVSDVDETVTTPLSPADYVREVAVRKARAVMTQWLPTHPHSSGILLSADTAVVLDDQILGKPTSVEDAEQTLLKLQGRWHEVYTALCLIDIGRGQTVTRHQSTRVHMRACHPIEARAYVATGEPMDKAGSYGIQGYGATLVTRIEGDYFTVVGLPLQLLDEQLRDWGYSLFS
jgi:septum formation protein